MSNLIRCLIISLSLCLATTCFAYDPADYEYLEISPYTGNPDCTWKQSAIESDGDARWLTLDQTTPQTIINGFPVYESGHAEFTSEHQLVDKKYVDDNAALLDDGTAAGQMAFWNGSIWTYTETTELFWDDTNKRLGIGTTTPLATLDVYPSTANSAIYSRSTAEASFRAWSDYNDDGDRDAFLQLGSGISTGDNPEDSWYIGMDASDLAKFKIGTPGAGGDWGVPGDGDILTIDLSGNVGIGTDSPQGILHLDAESGAFENLIFSNSGNAYNAFVFDADRTNADSFIGAIKGKWDGNHVAQINFESGVDTANKDDGLISFETSESGSNPVERMRISPSGNVGIGTDSPSSLLQVGDGTGNPEFRIYGDASAPGTGVKYGSMSINTWGMLKFSGDIAGVYYNTNLMISGSSTIRDNASQAQIGFGDSQSSGQTLMFYNLINNNIFAKSLGYDYGHSAQDNPTIFIHSDNNSQTEWLSFTHDQTNGVFGLGSGAYTFPDGDVGIGTASPLYSLDVDEIGNSAGDFKIQPDVQGDVVLFGDTDVGDAVDGKKFVVNRKAAEGDNYIEMYIDSYRNATLRNDSSGNGNFYIDNRGTGNIGIGRNSSCNITFFENAGAGENSTVRHYGYITGDTSKKYIQWQVSDTTDNFELTREDANIGAFDIQMPLITDLVTSSGGIIFPSSDPGVAGAWWDNAGTLTKSSG